MLLFESIVGISFKVPFVSVNNATGLSSFNSVHLLKDGIAITSPPLTYAEIGNGLYTVSYIPASTGVYTLFIESKIQATINVISKSLYTFLRNIEDESLGSWTWDKTSGTLIMLRQDGTTMAGFSVVDNLTTASRERTSP